MDSKNKIIKTIQQDNEMHFILAPETEWPLGSPTGKMLTDTDRQSFVYVFDHESGYRYAYFQQDSWNGLVEMLLNKLDPVIVWNDEKVYLDGAIEELEALVMNIEGNDNYGETFSAAVEEVFRSVLEQVD